MALGIRRHQLTAYFIGAFVIPAVAFVAVVGPHLLSGPPVASAFALSLFPVMELTICAVAIGLTAVVTGRVGLRHLRDRILRWRVGIRWYLMALLTPPVLVLLVLVALSAAVSPVFAPKIFLVGLAFGIPAGLFEEVGWSGFATPRLVIGRSPVVAGILLGIVWGLWHAPVVDHLGSAAPHGHDWLAFYAAFIAFVTPMRVLIVWLFVRTKSVLLTQLMHASSTAALVVLAPLGVTAAQEAAWYALYGAVLWIVVAMVAVISPTMRSPTIGHAQLDAV